MDANKNHIRIWGSLAAVLLFLLTWQALVQLLSLPAFILPAPLLVAQRFSRAVSDGTLLRHSAATMLEVMAGLSIGVLLATLRRVRSP